MKNNMENQTIYYIYGIDNTAYYRVDTVEKTAHPDEAAEIKDRLLSIYPLVEIETVYEDGTKTTKQYK